MSVSITVEPLDIQPIYNDIKFRFTSTNYTKLDFKFVCSLYSDSALLSSIKVPITIGQTFGQYNLYRHLISDLDYDFIDSTDIFQLDNNLEYYIALQETYRPYWEFTGSTSSGGGTLSFYDTTDPSDDFVVGDEIVVTQDSGYSEPTYNGIFDITSITFSTPYWLIVTDGTYTTDGTGDGGSISLSNFGMTTSAILATSSTKYAFNGVLDYTDFIEMDANSFIGTFLTNVPDKYEVMDDNRIKLSYYATQSTYAHITTNDMASLGFGVTGSSVVGFNYIGVGPYELGTSSTAYGFGADVLPIIKPTTTWYEVEILSVSGDVVCVPAKRFNVVSNCSRFDNLQVIFLDRKGSFVTFNFNYLNRLNKNVKRETYSNIPTNTYSYELSSKVFAMSVEETITLNTGFLNQDHSDYFMELIESPMTYLINEDSQMLGVVITVTSIERKQVMNEQLVNYTITVRKSIKNNTMF